jgi:hypothetical protein
MTTAHAALDYSAAAVASAAGADPWALHGLLASGDPNAILDAAVGFRRAGGHATDAAEQARVADTSIADAFRNDGQPVFDAAVSTTRSHILLGDGGEKMELAARAFVDVATTLAENTRRARSLVITLDTDIARIVGLRNSYVDQNAAVLTAQAAAAAEQRYHRMAVDATRTTAGAVQTEIDDYDAVLVNRTGRLQALGYLAATGTGEGPDEHRDPSPEELLAGIGEFVDGATAGAVDAVGGLVAGIESFGDSVEDTVTNGINELGNAIGGPVGDALVGAAGGLDDLGEWADDVVGGAYVGLGDAVGGETGEAYRDFGHDIAEDEYDPAFDFDGTGYSRDEIEGFINGHTDDGNPALGRPSAGEVAETLKHGIRTRPDDYSFEYNYTVNGERVRVYVNTRNPLRSTTVYVDQ